MSDEMMFGIAKMPYEMAMGDEMSRRQFYANTQRLAAALEAAREDATPPATSPVRILIDAIESEIRQLEGKADWKSQAARIASLRAAIDKARGKGGGEVGP